jgi:HicB family
MQTATYVQAIQGDLAAAASLGDESTAEAGRRLSLAVESSLHLRLLDLLTEVSVGLSAQLPSGRVEVRLSGRDPELVVVDEEPAAAQPTGPAEDGETARITLRLPEGLKLQAEAAAAREGVSTNTWLVRAVARALEPRPSRIRTGNRLQGYAQS